jgi:hypothetical protein
MTTTTRPKPKQTNAVESARAELERLTQAERDLNDKLRAKETELAEARKAGD